MVKTPGFFWKTAPFIRLTISLIIGILLQCYLSIPLFIPWTIFFLSLATVFSFFFISFSARYSFSSINGIAINLLFISLGLLLTVRHDVQLSKTWVGHSYKPGDLIMAVIDDETSGISSSLRANGYPVFLLKGNAFTRTTGKINLFIKNNANEELRPGDTILFKKPLQEIRNSGNPGTFDYQRYSLFNQSSHQVFLLPGEFVILRNKNRADPNHLLYQSREKIISVLRKYIPGEKEKGLAEALLIGFKEDLDPSLLQSYTQTGVVHIIAISGMHLALIYGLLIRFFKPAFRKKLRWLKPLLIIAGLWVFSIIAGAQPSVLRSALMFTCIVVGDNLARNSSVYNTLALSAFLLLCFNPYWLWDVGFQLSYAAVLSIVTFHKGIYAWFEFKNKILDEAWKLCAMSIAAQILTAPLTIYHFHQFPVYFIITNLVAVPLSSIIVVGELLLCTLGFFTPLGVLTGKVLAWLIKMMNGFIEHMETMPFSTWKSLSISVMQAAILFILIAGISCWLIYRSIPAVKNSLLSIFCFLALRSFSFIASAQQKKIIVYDIPRHTIIDFINGRNHVVLTDTLPMIGTSNNKSPLIAAQILFRLHSPGMVRDLQEPVVAANIYGNRMLFVNSAMSLTKPIRRLPLDLLLLTGKAPAQLSDLTNYFAVRRILAVGNVPEWKKKMWRKLCDSLCIFFHDVNRQGAFVVNLR